MDSHHHYLSIYHHHHVSMFIMILGLFQEDGHKKYDLNFNLGSGKQLQEVAIAVDKLDDGGGGDGDGNIDQNGDNVDDGTLGGH